MDLSGGYCKVGGVFCMRELDFINVDWLCGICENDNIFRDGVNRIKQIQHLEIFEEYLNIGNYLKEHFNIEGEIINMQLFIKYPGCKPTKAHQDGAYLMQLEPDPAKFITFWIPLCDVDENNSCLKYYRNTPNFLLPHLETGTRIRTRSGVTGYSLECVTHNTNEFTPITAKKGDVLIHTPLAIHHSPSNLSTTKRKALTCIIKLINNL